MKRRKLLKVLMLLLSVAVVFAGIAFSVSADGNDGKTVASVRGIEYDDFYVALESANDGDTVKLMADIELNASYEIKHDLTIALEGYTVSSPLDAAFIVNDDVDFTISGAGKFVLEGMLVKSSEGAPNVTVIGDSGTISIVHDGSIEPSIVSAVNGTYHFNNLDITAVTNGSSNATFHMSSSSGAAVFEFSGVRCEMTGCITSSTPAEALVAVQGNGYAEIKASTLISDGVGVRLTGTSYSGTVLSIEDSYIRSRSGSYDISAIGMYSNVQGAIIVKNSVIESSYRVVAVNSENIATQVEVDENGVISAVSGPRMLCYDSTLFLTSYKAGQVVRAIPTFLYGNSKIICSTGISSLVNFDTDTSSYVSANKYVNIYMAEGTRISRESYTTLATKGVKYPDGSAPGTSKTYTFVYDPIGDLEAPYVVKKIGAESTLDTSKIDFFYLGNGSDSVASSVDGVLYLDSSTKSGTIAGNLHAAKGFWWNRVGEYSIAWVGGNPCFKYATTEACATATTGPVLAFNSGSGSGHGVYENDYQLYIVEFDLATDTGSFVEGNFTTVSRGTASGGDNYSGLTNLKVTADGSLVFNSCDYKDETAKLSTTEWNKIAIVVDTDTVTVANGKTYGGTYYYYVNGSLVAYGSKAYLEGAYLFGLRFDIIKQQTLGRSALIDNVMVRGYKTVSDTEFSYDKYYGSSYDIKLPVNTNSPRSTYTVGGISMPDIETAISVASEYGTVANINEDVENINVKSNAVVAVNGHNVTFSDDSNKAIAYYYSDGTIASYSFDSKYNSYKVKYHWFFGDINKEEEWLDPGYYIETELFIGMTPEAPDSIGYETTIDYQNLVVNYHNGWDYDGDGKGPEPLSALSMSQVAGADDVYMYPTFASDHMTFVVTDTVSKEVLYYTIEDTIDSSDWSNFKAGTTVTLYSDFTCNASSGALIEEDGGVYNLDFNGHVINLISKATFIQVKNGATLNVYSSVPGGMFYAIERSERTTDGSTKVGAGVFVQLKDNKNAKGTAISESISNAKASTFATTLNVGKVTVDGKTYDGSNFTIAGDCLVEPRLGGYNASITIDGALLVRVGVDYDSGIFSRYYFGTLDIKNATLISAVKSAYFLGNHSSGDNAACVATVENCNFIYPANGSQGGNVIGRNNGFKSITFNNCTANARFNPGTKPTAIIVGAGTSAAALDFNASASYKNDIIKANYTGVMQMPEIAPSGYSSYITQSEDGVIRIKLWAYSSDTSLGSKGGAVDDGYLYIYPNGYEGKVADDATMSVTLPALEYMAIAEADAVDVDWCDLNSDILETQKYVKGSSVLAAPEVKVPDLSVGAVLYSHDGTWKNFPIESVSEKISVIPGFVKKVNLTEIKASVALHADFDINIYFPATYKDAIVSVTEGGKELEVTETVITEGGEAVNYLKVSVPVASYEASKDVMLTVTVSDGSDELSGKLTTSVAAYAKSILNNASSSAADVKLANYMVAYASSATKYFIGKEDATLSAMLVEVEDFAMSEALDVSAFGNVFESVTLDLGKSVDCVFVLKDGFAGKVILGGESYEVAADDDRTLVLSGLVLSNYAENLPVTVADSEGNTVLNAYYNVATFYEYHNANAQYDADSGAALNDSAKCLDLVKAFYNYANAALEYASSVSVE